MYPAFSQSPPGADPRPPITLTIPAIAAGRWTTSTWNRRRTTGTYSSSLDLALLAGSDIFINQGGPLVRYVDPVVPWTPGEPTPPRGWKATYRIVLKEVRLVPSLRIVRMLADYGAEVTDLCLNIAKQLKEGRDRFGESVAPRTDLLDLLTVRYRSTQPQPVLPPTNISASSITTTGSASSAPDPHLHSTLDRERESRESLQRSLATSSSRIAELERTTGELSAECRLLRQRNEELRSDLADSRARADSAAQLERERDALARELEAARALLASRDAQISSLERSLASATAVATSPALRPVPVKKVLYVIHNFEAQEADEVGLEVGDEVFCSFECNDGWGKVRHTRVMLVALIVAKSTTT
ncbi:hypothetical protein HDU93_008666 [Gonapodya sp. JEL0774]|nr:hypothetical protein HDU93_008666 [Gonapodya sp. JEL0774]